MKTTSSSSFWIIFIYTHTICCVFYPFMLMTLVNNRFSSQIYRPPAFPPLPPPSTSTSSPLLTPSLPFAITTQPELPIIPSSVSSLASPPPHQCSISCLFPLSHSSPLPPSHPFPTLALLNYGRPRNPRLSVCLSLMRLLFLLQCRHLLPVRGCCNHLCYLHLLFRRNLSFAAIYVFICFCLFI